MSPEVGPVAAIGIVIAVTYASRVGGLAVMARARISPRIERFLDAVAGAILVALVLPTLLAGEAGGSLAAVVAFGVMVRSGNAFNAMLLGVVATILLRAISLR